MMNDFLQDETGAVTVDWVVLTAALVGLGLAVVIVVRTGVGTQSQAIDDQLESDSIIKTSFSALGATTQLSASDVSSLQDAANGWSNEKLQEEYTAANDDVASGFDAWKSGVDDGSYTLDGDNYVDASDGNRVIVSESDYNASLLSHETASVYADEARQRGVTLTQ